MPKTLVVVESPAKAKTIEKYLGGDYTVRASYGHIRDLPKSELGVDVEHDFEPAYVVPEESKKHVRELKSAHKKADDLVLATDYDREGEAIAFHVATILGVVPGRREARHVHRDHEGRDPRGVPRPARDRHEAGRRAAGPARPRPARRLQDLAAAVEERPARSVRRPRPVGRGPPDRRARARDPGVQPDRVLERRRPAHTRRRPAGVPRPARRGARGQARRLARQEGRAPRRRARRRAARRTPEPRLVSRRGRRAQGAQALAGPAVHDVDAAAGGRAQARVLGAQDHDARPAPVRGRRPSGRGNGRPHHLHADRLPEHRRLRAPRDRRAGEDRVRADVRARGAAALQDQVPQRAGGARGDPSDVGAPHTRT